jgi:phospholipase A1
MADVVIVVPGTMGSVLVLDGVVIWPGPFSNLYTRFNRLEDLMKDGLIATDLVRSFVVEQYGALIKDLEKLGFHEKSDPRTLWLCPYDWRKSNLLAVDDLAAKVEEAAATNPGREIAIIAHSMGGLISRYYLESGLFKTAPGFGDVKSLITLGTPHGGAPEALLAILKGIRKAFLAADQVKKMANHDDFPSVYELLPPRGEPFAWNLSAEADLKALDIYDADLADRLGLNPKSLDSAIRFRSKLGAPNPQVRYFYFGGTREETTTAATLLEFGAAFRVEPEVRPDGGDGTVPIWSAIQTGVQCALVGAPHSTIFKDRDLANKLGRLLGRSGILAAEEAKAILLVRDEVVEAGKEAVLTLALPEPVTRVEAELRFMEVDEQGVDKPGGVVSDPIQLRYAGPPVDRIQFRARVPELGGFYAAETSGSHSARALLLVQE